MRLQLNETTSNNLRLSLLYSIGFSKKLLTENKTGMVGETVVQLLKDSYFLKTGRILQDNIVIGVKDLEIPFTEDELCFLSDLEKAMRFEEDYSEFTSRLNIHLLSNLLEKLDKYLNK
jgi:hypothetical protein